MNLPQENKDDWYVSAMERLVDIAQALSHAHDLDGIVRLVRSSARTLTGADGATFILRDGDKCHYVDEDAISPLWKGQRFPMHSCISGWTMLHGESASIEDIYADPRVPADAYRPTFVKSLVMVPVRKAQPIAAIGNYWASPRKASPREVSILEALANITSVALENVALHEELQKKLHTLEQSNHELERFAWAISHDLKTPLRSIYYLSEWAEEELSNALLGKSREYFEKMQQRILYMDKLLDDIRDYSQIGYHTDEPDQEIDGDTMIKEMLVLIDLPKGFTLSASDRFRAINMPQMPLRQIFYNLIDNAIKHHDKNSGRIEVDVEENEQAYIFSVRDDGPGIPAEYHQKIFDILVTLKPKQSKQSGMGLAFIKKTLDLYGGTIKVVSEPGRGAAFYFTWHKPLKNHLKTV